MSEPQTRKKLDFLYQEVLGEVAGLIQRIETVNDALAHASKDVSESIDAIHTANKQLSQLPEDAAKAAKTAIHESSDRVKADIVDAVTVSLSEVRLELDQLARNTARYATIALYSARKMALLALVVGAVSGAAAAMVVLLAIT
ncbi:hypothetical protein OURE66S_03596 [Oligella ureolytica]